MAIDEVSMERIENEIINSLDEEILHSFSKEQLAVIVKNILSHFSTRGSSKISVFEEVKLSTNVNKNGERLIYVRSTICHSDYGIVHYYAFDLNGNYVGYADLLTHHKKEPISTVELEYWSDGIHTNQGNITVLAKEVIREVFEGELSNSTLARRYNSMIDISKIKVSIHKENLPSIAVAKKLGFDDSGYLTIDDYYAQKEDSSSKSK